MARPTKYTPEIVKEAKSYLDGGYKEHGHIIPSIVGMAIVLKVGKSTLYDWAGNPENEFSDILEDVMDSQHVSLLNGGLSGDMNPSIVKLVLGKHSYSDKVEQDTYLSVDVSDKSDAELDAIINQKP